MTSATEVGVGSVLNRRDELVGELLGTDERDPGVRLALNDLMGDGPVGGEAGDDLHWWLGGSALKDFLAPGSRHRAPKGSSVAARRLGDESGQECK